MPPTFTPLLISTMDRLRIVTSDSDCSDEDSDCSDWSDDDSGTATEPLSDCDPMNWEPTCPLSGSETQDPTADCQSCDTTQCVVEDLVAFGDMGHWVEKELLRGVSKATDNDTACAHYPRQVTPEGFQEIADKDPSRRLIALSLGDMDITPQTATVLNGIAAVCGKTGGFTVVCFGNHDKEAFRQLKDSKWYRGWVDDEGTEHTALCESYADRILTYTEARCVSRPFLDPLGLTDPNLVLGELNVCTPGGLVIVAKSMNPFYPVKRPVPGSYSDYTAFFTQNHEKSLTETVMRCFAKTVKIKEQLYEKGQVVVATHANMCKGMDAWVKDVDAWLYIHGHEHRKKKTGRHWAPGEPKHLALRTLNAATFDNRYNTSADASVDLVRCDYATMPADRFDLCQCVCLPLQVLRFRSHGKQRTVESGTYRDASCEASRARGVTVPVEWSGWQSGDWERGLAMTRQYNL